MIALNMVWNYGNLFINLLFNKNERLFHCGWQHVRCSGQMLDFMPVNSGGKVAAN